MHGANLRTLILYAWITATEFALHDSGIFCGFPGAPFSGRVFPDKDTYKVNETVAYLCNTSFDLEGPQTNVCNPQGLWTNKAPPLCKRNAAFDSFASQSSTVGTFNAYLAIDGKPDTCAQTDIGPNNYWEIKMTNEILIKDVKIHATVGVRSFMITIEVSNKQGPVFFCDKINVQGRADIQVTSNCVKHNPYNKTGSVLRITDERSRGKLHLCEVKISIDEAIKCGKPDVKPHCRVREDSQNGFHTASYEPKPGYRLFNGDVIRICKSGKWPQGTTPLCLPVPDGTHQYTNSSDGKTTGKNGNNTKSKNGSESEKTLGTGVIVGIAAGITVTSLSTIIIIIIVISITRKYYRRGSNRGGPVTSQHEGMFLHNNPSSCGSTSPTIRPNYSDPWDDPSTHVYDYINPETLLSSKNKNLNQTKAETSLSSPTKQVDGMGYLVSRRSCPQDSDPNAREQLIVPVNLRHKNSDCQHLQAPAIPLQQDSRMNSVNELEVDAYGGYGFPESESTGSFNPA